MTGGPELTMSSFNIQLPTSLKDFLDQQVAAGGHQDVSDYVRGLVEAERLRKVREELEANLLEAINSPSSPMTAADFEDIRREGHRQIEELKRSKN